MIQVSRVWSERGVKGVVKMTLLSALMAAIGLSSFGLSACSKEEEEATEWDNWQQRNEAYFASLADSLSSNPAQWQRLKLFSLDPATEGKATDYVYAKTIESGTGTGNPAYTDSLLVIYQGRLIPTATYPQGYVFDTTVSGTFSITTGNVVKQVLSQMIDGYATALQHMHSGDHWRIYIPSDLGYGAVDNSNVNVRAYSTLIFDVQLVGFSHAGNPLPAWSARRR